jgi:nucleoid DNA-binding protein
MMMTELVLKYLLNKKEVKIPGFGTFLKRASPAFYDEKLASLLPPGNELFFSVDFDLKDESFIHFLSEQKNISFFESQSKILELTNYWKSTLESKKEIELSGLGIFYISDDHLVFKGKRFTTENPDNFGLEEVNLENLKNKTTNFESGSNTYYKKSSNNLWWLFFIIPTALIVYYTAKNQELIFGKISFQNLNKTKKNPFIQKDSFKKPTVKMDSIALKNTANAQK